jgi:hypothetical protein
MIGMVQTRHIYLLVTGVYLFIAAMNLWSDGWRDLKWVAWACLAGAFFLLHRLPDPARRSIRQALRLPTGIAAWSLCALALGLLIYRVGSRNR